jgi:TonB family protein
MTGPAEASVPPAAPDESWLAGPHPPREGWTQKKFLVVLTLLLALHVALIFLFGTKKKIVPRAVAHVPVLQVVNGGNELIALSDPSLFAHPNPHDGVSMFWRQPQPLNLPDFNYSEPPQYLDPSPAKFTAGFRDFVRDSESREFPLNFKPEPQSLMPPVPEDGVLPTATTMRITGDLATRPLLQGVTLPALRYNDVVEPTTVQALVDAAGNVVSAVVLKPNGDPDADQQAVRLTSRLRFAPAPDLTFGVITYTWHTIPLANTNSVP